MQDVDAKSVSLENYDERMGGEDGCDDGGPKGKMGREDPASSKSY